MKMIGEAQIKTIGLWGIVFTIVGFVVGISIFILPAELIIIAGPGVILAYAVAGAMAVVSCFATAQIGTLMPAEGGTFIALSKLLSPFMGFLAVWVLLAAVVLVNAFVSYGFADYLVYFIPGLDKTLVAVCVLIFFGLVNVLGSTLVVKFQSIMVIILIIMLSIFILSGVPYFEADNLSPFMPRGLPSVFQAATLGYFSFAGFIFLRLRGILGKRTGFEGKVPTKFDKVLKEAVVKQASQKKEIFDELAQKEFLNGAKIAYEAIITDFSDNDNKITKSKPLLNKEIYNQFNEALKERSKREHYAEITFIGINSAIIKEHKKIDKILNVTVDFIAEVITCIKDKDKKVVSGDPEKIKKIYDTWVFSRDITSANPNWQLVNTLT